MEKLTVERTIWIAAPHERVWQAVTEPEQLAQWFLSPFLGAQMKRDDQGKTFVCMGEMMIPVARFEASESPRQTTIRGLPDGLLAVTITFEEEKGGTHVAVTMSGFESLPKGSRQERLAPSGLAWEKALENLKAYLAGKELPFPEGYVAALFGYRREAQAKYSVERSIWINAPRPRVWQAITDPVEIQKWFSPGTAWGLSALEVGGRLYVVDAESGAETHTQVIEVVDPPYQFAIRARSETLEKTEEVTTHFLEEEKGGTRLTVLSAGYEVKTDELRHQSMEQNAFGFGMMLENLQAYVEGASLPYPGGF